MSPLGVRYHGQQRRGGASRAVQKELLWVFMGWDFVGFQTAGPSCAAALEDGQGRVWRYKPRQDATVMGSGRVQRVAVGWRDMPGSGGVKEEKKGEGGVW